MSKELIKRVNVNIKYILKISIEKRLWKAGFIKYLIYI